MKWWMVLGVPGGGTSRVAGVLHERCDVDMGVYDGRGAISSGGRGYPTYEALTFKRDWQTWCHPWARMPKAWPSTAMDRLQRYAGERLAEAKRRGAGGAGVKGWMAWAFVTKPVVPSHWRFVVVERELEETVRRYAKREDVQAREKGYKRWDDPMYRRNVLDFIRLQHSLVQHAKSYLPKKQVVVVDHHATSDADIERMVTGTIAATDE